MIPCEVPQQRPGVAQFGWNHQIRPGIIVHVVHRHANHEVAGANVDRLFKDPITQPQGDGHIIGSQVNIECHQRLARADGTLAIRYARADGAGFLVYALGFTLVRLGNHFLRARQAVVTAPEWFYPVFYLTLAAMITGLLVWRVRRGGASPGDDAVAGGADASSPSADASGGMAEKDE